MTNHQNSASIKEPMKTEKESALNGGQREPSPDSASDLKAKELEDVDNIKYPEPWKYAKFFIGGYSQGRMFK